MITSSNNRELLVKAIDAAAQSGSFHVLNLIEKQCPLCVWGAGNRFLNTYERLFKRRGLQIDFIVDSDPQKQGRRIVDNIVCISPDELCRLNNPLVIPVLYAENAFEEICQYCERNRIEWIHVSHFLLDMQVTEHKDVGWFIQQRDRIMQVFDSLADELYQYVYAHAIRNRINHGCHNLSDYWEVPLLLKELVPKYRLIVRHHSDWNGGTVCYAWKD